MRCRAQTLRICNVEGVQPRGEGRQSLVKGRRRCGREAVGCMAAGCMAAGCVAVGCMAAGCMAAGCVAVGYVAVGYVAVGLRDQRLGCEVISLWHLPEVAGVQQLGDPVGRCRATSELQLHLQHRVRELRHLVERREGQRALPLVVAARLQSGAQLRVQRASDRRVTRALERGSHVLRPHRRPELLLQHQLLHLGRKPHCLVEIALELAPPELLSVLGRRELALQEGHYLRLAHWESFLGGRRAVAVPVFSVRLALDVHAAQPLLLPIPPDPQRDSFVELLQTPLVQVALGVVEIHCRTHRTLVGQRRSQHHSAAPLCSTCLALLGAAWRCLALLGTGCGMSTPQWHNATLPSVARQAGCRLHQRTRDRRPTCHL
eukprot:573797-Prymnesium_polylepis.7